MTRSTMVRVLVTWVVATMAMGVRGSEASPEDVCEGDACTDSGKDRFSLPLPPVKPPTRVDIEIAFTAQKVGVRVHLGLLGPGSFVLGAEARQTSVTRLATGEKDSERQFAAIDAGIAFSLLTRRWGDWRLSLPLRGSVQASLAEFEDFSRPDLDSTVAVLGVEAGVGVTLQRRITDQFGFVGGVGLNYLRHLNETSDLTSDLTPRVEGGAEISGSFGVEFY